MKTRIEIDARTLMTFWLVPLGIVLAGLAIYGARSALVIIGAAFFLALALNAPVSWVERKIPGRSRVGSTALAFVMVVVLIGMFIVLVVPPILQQTAKFAQTIPAIVDSATTQYQGVNDLIDRYNLQGQVDNVVNSVRENATSWAAAFGSNIVGGISSLGGAIVSLFLVIVLSFLMLIEGPALLGSLWKLYGNSKKRDYHQQLAHRMYFVVTGYVTAQLAIAGIGAVATGLLVFILSFIFDTPSNLAIPAAAIYFILTLIPMFGSTIAAILIGLLLVLNDPAAALVFIVIYIIYQQIENNIISPIIQSRSLEMTALWVLLAVTIGIYVFGLIGALISIPIAGCLKVLFDDYVERSKHERAKASKKPLAKLMKKSS